MAFRMRQMLPVAGTIVAASIVASVVGGVLVAIWISLTLVFLPGAKVPALVTLVTTYGTLAAFAVVLSVPITLALTTVSAIAAHIGLRHLGGHSATILPVGGFIVGFSVWLAFVWGTDAPWHVVSNAWSAPLGGIAGLVAGRILARLWTRPSS